MERQNPIKNWKYVHHNRKQSGDSMDVSVESVQSNRSGKFNRFQFKKGEEGNHYSSRDDLRREPIFVFTGRSREKNQEFSILSKRSGKDKESDTSKISDNDIILKGITREINKPLKTPILTSDLHSAANVHEILKTVKTMTEEFKKIITHFSKQYRDLRYEWDRSFKHLLSLQLNQESQTISQLKQKLERKQSQLDQLSRVSFDKNMFNTASAVKQEQRANENDNSLSKLAISKVQPIRDKETLSRNNTIAEFLCHQSMLSERHERQVGRDVKKMRQTIRRMHEILQE